LIAAKLVDIVFNPKYSPVRLPNTMAKVEYSFPVDKVHGKVSKSHKIGFAHRKASKLNYTTSYGTRITPYSQDEMAHQEKFRAVAASTRARMKDPGKVMQDQAAFKEQSKYKTFYRYVFNQEWEAYTEG
jgi:hypothetical protein